MSNIIPRKSAFIVLLVAISAPSMASVPIGMCPEEGQFSVFIPDLMESDSPSWAGFAHALLPQDANGDGYACAVYRCTPCPPNAKTCNQVCNWTGPLADNDVLF